MNKQELIKIVAEKSEVSQKVAADVLDNTLNAIMETVVKGDKVQVIGFGTFEAKQREARVGINPRTRQSVEIPAAVVPVFKAGKTFKEKANKR